MTTNWIDTPGETLDSPAESVDFTVGSLTGIFIWAVFDSGVEEVVYRTDSDGPAFAPLYASLSSLVGNTFSVRRDPVWPESFYLKVKEASGIMEVTEVKTGSYSVVNGEYAPWDISAGNGTATLPALEEGAQCAVHVVGDANGNSLAVNVPGGASIIQTPTGLASTVSLSRDGETFWFYCNGTYWLMSQGSPPLTAPDQSLTITGSTVTAKKQIISTALTSFTLGVTANLQEPEFRDIECTAGTGVAVQIPLDSTWNADVETEIYLWQIGAGQITVSGAVGVTVNAPGGKLKTAAQYDCLMLRKRAANTWIVIGGAST